MEKLGQCILGTAYQLAGPGVSDCSDAGVGAVSREEIHGFYDWLADPSEYPAQKLWIAGYAEYRKYEAERRTARRLGLPSVVDASASSITLALELTQILKTSDDVYVYVEDNAPAQSGPIYLYDEPLTLYTKPTGELGRGACVPRWGESRLPRPAG